MTKEGYWGYRKRYSLRLAVPGKKSIEVCFPYEVVEKEARRRNISVRQFLDDYRVIADYDNFEGVYYTFQKRDGEQ